MQSKLEYGGALSEKMSKNIIISFTYEWSQQVRKKFPWMPTPILKIYKDEWKSDRPVLELLQFLRVKRRSNDRYLISTQSVQSHVEQ